MHHIPLGRYRVPVPRSKPLRIFTGILLVICGLVGFLPLVGFWMLPLGLIILSIDITYVRVKRRRLAAWWRLRRMQKNI